jgi:lipopolysaccharide biosynthesis glycosyltransferase
MGYTGWAIYMDCDMLALADIAQLWEQRNEAYALQCVQHDYKTKQQTKFWANHNNDYPRKNWSSLMLINCSHPANAILTPQLIETATGQYLHQLSWLEARHIGKLPIEWNWLADEYGANPNASLVHYTLGSPCIDGYANTPMANLWFEESNRIHAK